MIRLCILLFIVSIISCKQEEEANSMHMPELMEIPHGFPEIDFPEDNEFTFARWELGKKLFFDPIMSADMSISCASCHQSELAFSDDVALSLGVDDRPGTRNSPSIANVAYHPYLTRDGGVPTLEMQILVPIQEHNEFDFNILLIADRLVNDSAYLDMSQEAYGRIPDAFVITRSLACFERSLLSGNSPYDQYIQNDNLSSMSQSAIDGMELFFSEKTNCSSCHSGFNFTNYAFENNGLYEDYEDVGRFRLTGEESDRALFKVPSLRNIDITPPYMHDGSLNTLEEVVDHYRTGGEDHIHKSALIQPLDLSEQEVANLILFLKSLSDESFISNPIFKN